VTPEEALSSASAIGGMPDHAPRRTFGVPDARRALAGGHPQPGPAPIGPLPARVRNPVSPAFAARPSTEPAPSPALDVARPGDRYTRTDLRPGPRAAAQARDFTRKALSRWNLGHLTGDAVAIASELATNASAAAIPPAGPYLPIIFAVHDRPPELRIMTWDNGPGQPEPTRAGPNAETGRGLVIIDALTVCNWGWWATPESGGKVVWASIRAPRQPG
jgi:anti-sigma regulatory factor (Ser/Thr protein kinase)